ncbi:hypothetical protein CHS0354_009649 [Potamilus streckersoni]|uniref:Prolyl 4-hydroxylase alpha subunit domain-containing protein n=1 Tax=Potamilus streckersoni TaxID=2493646 RepID=A0AAE0S481_9BIVA|nr:hypothetical protein CHS0354_009649 [Potamilus streckersoni]
MSGKRNSITQTAGQTKKHKANRIINTQDPISLEQHITKHDLKQKITDAWKTQTEYYDESSGTGLYHKPFAHCILPNFVPDKQFVESLQNELMDLNFTEKSNDLYKFHQSIEDLKVIKSPFISKMRRLLYQDLHTWLCDVTGIPLNNKMDLSCAQYSYTDILCCHDDELEERRIAFIYYLVPSTWTEKDGGALELFDTDAVCQPGDVVKSIVPVRNNFVFFEVSAISFHQVAEILSEDKIRLSISGWFHGPPIKRPKPHIEPPLPIQPYGSIDEEVFFGWINPAYLSPDAQGEIQEKFETDSEIELQEFLQTDKYEALINAVRESSIKWCKKGPANKRMYYQGEEGSFAEVLKVFLDLLRSDAMFLLLSNLTGLKLHELAASDGEDDEIAENSNKKSKEPAQRESGVVNSTTKESEKACTACCRCEVRQWSHGNYTLVHDEDSEESDYALDLIFYLGGEGWEMEYGGSTSYIAKGEDEELLTVCPSPNSLALIYRDKDSLKFVKHVNNRIWQMPGSQFYDVSAVYYE